MNDAQQQNKSAIDTTNTHEHKRQLTIKFCVDSVLEEGPGTKVDELQLSRFEIDQNVLVLDVSVQDPTAGDRLHNADDLAEELAGGVLVQGALLRDEVEEVLDWLWTLHDQDEGVWPLEGVQELDDAADRLRLAQQTHLQGNAVAVHLQKHKREFLV